MRITQDQDIFKNGCLVSLSVSKWGISRKVPKVLLEELEAEAEWVSAYKRLISKDPLKPINRAHNRAKNLLNEYAIPFPIRGVNFVPKKLIEHIDTQLREYHEQFHTAVEEFVQKYDHFKSEAERHLGPLYDPSQYPHDIRHYFGFSWRFFHIGVPDQGYQLLSPEQYEEEVGKMRDTIKETKELAVKAIRSQYLDLLTKTITKLKDKSAQRIHKTEVTRLTTFLEVFKDRNIFGDHKMEEIADLSQEILEDVEVEDIRTDEEFREEVASNLDEVHTILAKAMVRKPRRKIRLKFV